jgi:hypothetical protein
MPRWRLIEAQVVLPGEESRTSAHPCLWQDGGYRALWSQSQAV